MSTAFALRFARIAQQQYDRFRFVREGQPPLLGQVQRYWRDLGLSFPGVSTAWSAVFISWCAKQAGANKSQFPFSARHSSYIFEFIKHRQNNTGVFRAYATNEYAPKVGDILQNNRSGGALSYSDAARRSQYASHCAIVIEVGVDARGNYLRTVGGNESDSVGLKEVRLSASGRVLNPQGFYISVVDTLL